MRAIVACILILRSFLLLSAQNRDTHDSVIHRQAYENALNRSLKTQRAINTGIEYGESLYDIRNGHQYFLSEERLSGDIVYSGVIYKNQLLQYDIIQDEVIVEHTSGHKIMLVKERIAEFEIEGHVFRRFGVTGDKAKSGFYELLQDEGNVSLLVKREKKLRGQSNYPYRRQEKSLVEERNRYFLVKDRTFFLVRNYKDIVKLLYNGKVKSVTDDVKRIKSKEAQMIFTVSHLYPTKK
jgi:hypothetical protein